MPIVTTSSGAVDFKQDLLLIGNSSTQLIQLIESLKNENDRKSIGKSLRKEIEQKYNADIEIKKIIKLYKEYLD